jgi:ABC-type Fe3+/spermidine/putrescine transport system ATPase subunit
MSDLIFEGITKQFGAALAVSDVSLVVQKGESIVVIGPSGCGKTTTLRMIAGFERPTSGRLTIGGQVMSDDSHFVPPEDRAVGMVFQSYALWPHMTVAANIAFGLTVGRKRKAGKRLSKKAIADRVDATLNQVQLDGLAKRYPHELSGGQQQRVALGRALITEPRVLLLDEPLSNLDTRLREDMRLQIRRLQRESGITMVYITHDRTEALALADRVVVLNSGEVEQIGPPAEIYENPRTEYVARSLGPANLIAGDVVENGTVRLETGQTIAVGMDCHEGSALGGVSVCVRPRDIGIRSAQSERGAARIDEAVYLGDEIHYRVSHPDWSSILQVVSHGAPAIPRGESVVVTVAAGSGNIVGPHAVAPRRELTPA